MPDRSDPVSELDRRAQGRTLIVERLVQAAVEQIATCGKAATSARSVAEAAGASPSAINYNLGGVERLFSAAFAQGAAATAEWLGGVEQDIAALPASPAGAALALEHVIAEWSGQRRNLALLYQEAQAAGPGVGPAGDWARHWRGFWLRTAKRSGLGEAEGRLMHAFFESEALYHLSTWSPALERAALRETCGWFAAVWLGAPRMEPTGALALAERTAGVLPEGSIAPAAVKIVEAAAVLVNEVGLGGLTHRAVAARAGVTTGAVTHHFRTIEELAAGTIRGQVLAMRRAPASPAAAWPVASREALFAAIKSYAATDRPWGPSLLRRQLFLAAVRRPNLAGSAAVIRYAHGGTVGESLGRLFGFPPTERSLYAGVISRLVSGSWYASSAGPSIEVDQALLIEEVERRLLRHVDRPASAGA